MAKYRFKAYTSTGRLESGEVDAQSERTALEALKSRGLFVSEIGQGYSISLSSTPWWQRELSTSRSLDVAGQAMLARELATLLGAGVTVDEALGIIVLQPRIGARMRNLISSVQLDVRGGASLSAALAGQDGAVPEAFWMLVRAGETGGTIKEVLGELASSMDEVARLRKQLFTAMVYPLVLLVASAITVLLILTVMVPAIIPLFRDAGVEPPFLISALAGLERILFGYWPVLLGGLVAVVACWRIAMRDEKTALAIDRFALQLPVVRGIVQRIETARFSRTLSMLLRNGVPMLDALRVSGRSLNNRAFRRGVAQTEEEVNRGGTLIASLARTALLPTLAMRLIALGEQSGQLSTMLARVAEIYELDVRQYMERLLALSTPAVTIAIGGFVGFIMLSVVSAMLSLNEVVLR